MTAFQIGIKITLLIWLGNMGAVIFTLGLIHSDNVESLLGMFQMLFMGGALAAWLLR